MNLKVDQLSKAYGDISVIDDFSFEMTPGERVALTGKSGTGKTTFMRIINNLEKADRGTVQIGDSYLFKDSGKGAVYSSSNEQRQYQNSMGMVFQNYALFPNFDILENLLEAPLAQKLDDEETLKSKALDLLNKMGIKDQADKMPHQLSGGQQQRAAVARALMLEPAYLCLDEPTSALDRESADSIGHLLEDLSQEGMGVLIVTHDLPFAEEFSTRTISSQAFLRKEVLNG